MAIRSLLVAVTACLCVFLISACQTGGSRGAKSSIKESMTNRSIERARLHDAAELKTAYDSASGDADEVLLLFMNAVLLIEEDKDAGYAAVAYMSRTNDQKSDSKSPTGVMPTQMASEGLRRVWEKPEIGRSYTGGSGSDYKMSAPEVVELSIKETREESSTRVKYFIWSSGKDNASPIALREEGGRWYVDEWSSIQTGVKK